MWDVKNLHYHPKNAYPIFGYKFFKRYLLLPVSQPVMKKKKPSVGTVGWVKYKMLK